MTERTMKVERALRAIDSVSHNYDTLDRLKFILKHEDYGHEYVAQEFRAAVLSIEDFNEIIRRQDVLDYRRKFLGYEAQGTPRNVAYGLDGDVVAKATKLDNGQIHVEVENIPLDRGTVVKGTQLADSAMHIEVVSTEETHDVDIKGAFLARETVRTEKVEHKAPRILTLDIEMAPNLAFVWGLFNQNIGINQISDSATMLCWAAKYYGEREVYSASTYEMSRREMLEELSRLINDADIVVHYNGLGYDMPHIRRELVELGLPPLKPVREIDLLRTVRKQFKFTSNKLDYVSQKLLSDKKVQTGGFELWVGCMSGDLHAWEQMIEYNRHDVVLTEKLYEKLVPWIKNPPNMALIKGNPHGCPVCGEDPQVPVAPETVYTAVQAYEGFPCGNCGCWIRTNQKAFEPMTFRIAN